MVVGLRYVAIGVLWDGRLSLLATCTGLTLGTTIILFLLHKPLWWPRFRTILLVNKQNLTRWFCTRRQYTVDWARLEILFLTRCGGIIKFICALLDWNYLSRCRLFSLFGIVLSIWCHHKRIKLLIRVFALIKIQDLVLLRCGFSIFSFGIRWTTIALSLTLPNLRTKNMHGIIQATSFHHVDTIGNSLIGYKNISVFHLLVKIDLLRNVFGRWRSIFLFREVARYLGSNRKHSLQLKMALHDNLVYWLQFLFVVLLLFVLLGKSWWKQARLGFAWTTWWLLDIRCAFKRTLIWRSCGHLPTEIMRAPLINFSRPGSEIGSGLVLVLQLVHILGHPFGYFF